MDDIWKGELKIHSFIIFICVFIGSNKGRGEVDIKF